MISSDPGNPVAHDVLVPSKVVFQSSSMVAQHNAAVAGVGLVLLPSFSAAEDSRLIPVMPHLCR